MVVLASVLLTHGGIFAPTLLYIGPDVFMPLTSAIAAVAGLALMFWQKIAVTARSLWRAIFSRRD
jgi:hypothetical protein